MRSIPINRLPWVLLVAATPAFFFAIAAWLLIAGPGHPIGAGTPAPAAGRRAVPEPGLEPALEPVAPPSILVQVDGAVANPGVYRLDKGARVGEAIQAAGGLARDADPLRGPNLVAHLRDGQLVRVPALAAGGSTGRRPGASIPAGLAVPRPARVSVNTGSVDELLSVPGLSPESVALILNHRESAGPLTSLGQLASVLGISSAEYQQAKPYLKL